MLTHIYIRDLATIEEVNIALPNGNTMITGETGAGKSIFIEAIELALGSRASANLIRSGKEKSEISLSFDVTHFPHVITRLNELELWHDSAECLIRRVITNDGRSKSYINGIPQPLHIIKEFGELLFHLHGQYEQQVLLKSDTQREMLDRFGDHLPLANEVYQLAHDHRKLSQQIAQYHQEKQAQTTRMEYLRFQISELEQLQLAAGEWESLETEHHRLTHAEDVIKQIQNAYELLSDNEHQGITSLLKEIRKILDIIRTLEPKSVNWQDMLESAQIQLSELQSELNDYLQHQVTDPETLHTIETRISQIFTVSRKHKIPPQDLAAYHEKLAHELHVLDSQDQDLSTLEATREKLEAAYLVQAQKLSQSRKAAALTLEKNITATIRSLSLPHSEFHITLEPEASQMSPLGIEKITFEIKTNPDQVLQPLNKVISGGELSRLSLAAHLALAHRTSIPTLIFDEVDTGLSGATAEKIGKLLRELGKSYQVFCITHQPQVAACGHHQLLVEKSIHNKKTHTTLRLLDQNERSREIARMLGGEKITDKTLAHAKEVLENI